jgi:hypothetical protein
MPRGNLLSNTVSGTDNFPDWLSEPSDAVAQPDRDDAPQLVDQPLEAWQQ